MVKKQDKADNRKSDKKNEWEFFDRTFFLDNIGSWAVSVAALVTLIFTIISVSTLIKSWKEDHLSGPITFILPSEYSVIRGAKLHFPSDHIALPLMLINEGGRPILISNVTLDFFDPCLTYKEISEVYFNPNENPTSDKVYNPEQPIFSLLQAGVYPNFESIANESDYTISTSISLDGYEATNNLVVFHIPYWYGDPDYPDNFKFRIEANRYYQVVLRYRTSKNENIIEQVGILYIYGDVAKLKQRPEKGRFWEHYGYDFIDYKELDSCD